MRTIIFMISALMLSSGIVSAEKGSPLTPELAAKQENYRKQKEQQHITQDKRNAAAEALKEERRKVFKARQTVKQLKKSEAQGNM